jgi:predicted TIM-barrel fold metal-dependent hydrolase
VSNDPILAATKAHPSLNLAWLATHKEAIVDPDLEIIDPHHHLLDMPGKRYLFDEALADMQSGHNIVASVHVQSHSMYRADGPQEMKPLGETEFANGMAAQCASGGYGRIRMCAGIVGSTDILLGGRVEPVLEAHLRAAGSRFKGIRPTLAWHESPQVRALEIQPHILMQPQSREAIACIHKLGLSLDVWVFFTQLDEVLDVCRSFPDLTVVINHTGGPVAIGPYAGQREAVFKEWRKKIDALATCPNAFIKLGGQAMRYSGFAFNEQPTAPSSDLLAEKWAPYFEVCIEAFGAGRCMFESNFPIDKAMCSYHVIWNAFKKITKGCSAAERANLFKGAAARAYRLD